MRTFLLGLLRIVIIGGVAGVMSGVLCGMNHLSKDAFWIIYAVSYFGLLQAARSQ